MAFAVGRQPVCVPKATEGVVGMPSDDSVVRELRGVFASRLLAPGDERYESAPEPVRMPICCGVCAEVVATSAS